MKIKVLALALLVLTFGVVLFYPTLQAKPNPGPNGTTAHLVAQQSRPALMATSTMLQPVSAVRFIRSMHKTSGRRLPSLP